MPLDHLPALDDAALAAVARLWPSQGSRHDAYMSLCGGLLRAGWTAERVEAVVSALCDATDDGELSDRLAIVKKTAERLQQDEPCYGWPRLAELIGPEEALSIRLAVDVALSVDALASAKELPSDFLRSLGVADADGSAGHVLIPYKDASGKTVAVRKRFSLGSKPRWEKGTKVVAYGEDRLGDAVHAGYMILCEGESDSWVLWYHGYPALGIPGAECTRVLHAGHVAATPRIYVVREADGAGERFVNGVGRRLGELQWSGELSVIKMTAKAKDVSAFYINDPDSFKERWQKRMDRAEPIDQFSVDPLPATPVPLPYKPFPVDALPAPLAAFVRQGATALGCDPSYFALPVLAVAAAMIGNSRVIRLKRGWIEPSVVWAAVVGDSGTLKSPALRLAVSPVYRMQKELLDAYKEEKTAYDAVKGERERAIKQAKKDGKPPDDVLPEPPTPGRILTGDTTIEKLGQLLADNARGMLVCRDELRSWFASFTRYKGQAGGSDLPAWLEFFRAESVIIDRKTGDRPTLFIPRASVSVCGGIQPGTLARALTADAYESGLAARLLVAMPPKQPKRWSEAEIDGEAQQKYEALLRRLFALKPDEDAKGEAEPFNLKLTEGAKAAWVNFYQEWASKQADAEGELSAALSKLEAYAARFALIHHVVTRVDVDADDSDPITPASIAAGATLARWFAYEAERVYSVCRASDAERQTRRLLEYIQGRGGEITARTLQRANPSRYRTTEDAEAVLDDLVKRRMGVWVDTSPGPKGGRPSRIFRLESYLTQPKPDETPAGVNGVSNAALTQLPILRANPAENEVVSGFGFVSSDSEERIPSDGPGGFVSGPKEDKADNADGGEGELIL